MKYNTVMEHWQTATTQSFSVTQNPDTGDIIRSYFDDGEISLRFISKQIGNAMIYTKTELQPFQRIHTLTDRAGNEVTDEVYEVQTENPTLNPLGFSDGYSYKVKKVA